MERRQAKGQNQLAGSAGEGDSIFLLKNSSPDFPKGPEVKTLCSHSRGHAFAPWLGN